MKSKELFQAVFSRHVAAYQSPLQMVMSSGEAQGRIRVDRWLPQMDPDARRRFVQDASATLKQRQPGPIETTGPNHLLLAIAG